jgi:putative Ca2+/H+ antiporter (TMEM165/GDT1 family)
MKLFAAIFWTVFLAEIGDKTQLATVLFSAEGRASRPLVFAASAAALVTSTLLAVLFGQQLAALVPARVLKLISGIGFLLIGSWLLWEAGLGWSKGER